MKKLTRKQKWNRACARACSKANITHGDVKLHLPYGTEESGAAKMKRTDAHRPSAIAPATVLSASPQGTGLRGLGASQIITRFFGRLSQWPIEPDGHNFTQAQIQAIAEHIDRTGDCLWHAEFVVMGWEKCHCVKCLPLVHAGGGVQDGTWGRVRNPGTKS